ncbi:MAG: phosphate-starvation-inducible PsiE family protein [Cyanobacteriota bacterium]|nr:phosphate-starvation-inducible PsiE family protein [Cyanobacteriota bacterium]
MSQRNKFVKQTASSWKDENFLGFIKQIENLVSKALAIAMVLVILVAIFDLGIFLSQELFASPMGFYNKTLIQVFGLFLNILIALELLENITAYLQKHVVQVELVIVTSLIAVARKIIIFDFSKSSGTDLIGLAIAIFALAISYWIVRYMNTKEQPR